MSKRNVFVALFLVAGLAVVAAGCKGGKKGQEELIPQPSEPATRAGGDLDADRDAPVEVTEPWREEAPEVREVVPPTIAELNARGVLKTVYFDFDKADLSDEARAVLRANAEWLRANLDYGVVIEGHCDERGTIEYNLALGQRRARGVNDYLTSLGVNASRLRTKSFGEERPAVMGHDDSAWSRNRRAEFVIE